MTIFDLISEGDLMPHGHCLVWRPDLLGLHVISDAITVVAYLAIPVALIYLVRKRQDFGFNAVFWMFALFITFCAVSHLMSIINIWNGYYFVEGLSKAATAAVSAVTAFMIWRLMPVFLAIPSNETLRLKNEELRRIEAKLLESNANLERRVEERTHDLEISRDRALAASNAESRFLSNMSHEIRNPLNGVMGLIRQALEEKDTNVLKDQLKTAAIAGQQLQGIIDDVLDFKKLEAGQFTLRSETFDYHELTDSLRKLFAGLAEEKNIDLQFRSASDDFPRFLIGDKVRIGQIINNVLGNALKFTPENGMVITTRSYDYETESMTVTVQDSGIGMSPETISTLYTRFKQGQDGTNKAHGGTGLGLSITKQLLELGGGSITVQSEQGEGSTFTLTAPLPVDWEKENRWREKKEVEAPIIEKTNEDLSGLRILCVDDSNINLKVISRPLTKAGAEVITTMYARDALDLIRTSDFDLVITDISMPEMDGEELQQELKEWQANLPVIAVTGNVLEEDVKRYLSNGFVAALSKPVDFAKLFELIDRFALRS